MEALLSPITIKDVHLSYGRCVMSEGFFDDFYTTFFNSSPEIPKHFSTTNMDKQKQLLRQGITYLIMYADAKPMSINKVEELGKSHSKDRLNIKPPLYKFWLDSLLSTVNKHDKRSNDLLLAEWKKVISLGIQKMISMY